MNDTDRTLLLQAMPERSWDVARLHGRQHRQGYQIVAPCTPHSAQGTTAYRIAFLEFGHPGRATQLPSHLRQRRFQEEEEDNQRDGI